MTPLYKDTQAEVDAHNEKVNIQREAFIEGSDLSPYVGAEEARERAEKKYPFAELRPSGFVGGSGWRYEWRDTNHARPSSTERRPVTVFVPACDRAAASAALTGGVGAWLEAIQTVAERHGCSYRHVIEAHQPEIITEAQAILDREGGK